MIVSNSSEKHKGNLHSFEDLLRWGSIFHETKTSVHCGWLAFHYLVSEGGELGDIVMPVIPIAFIAYIPNCVHIVLEALIHLSWISSIKMQTLREKLLKAPSACLITAYLFMPSGCVHTSEILWFFIVLIWPGAVPNSCLILGWKGAHLSKLSKF